MHVFHIANYYTGSKVYKELSSALDNDGIRQTIYTAFLNKKAANKNNVEFKTPHSKVIYRNILNLYTRINYLHKARKLTNDAAEYFDPKEVNIIHAHTLFSDGVIACRLHKKHNTPYIVAVRNTDINIFFKFMIHLRVIGIEVLRNAQQVICISPAYKKRLLNLSFVKKELPGLEDKCIVVPNGLDNFWINHPAPRKSATPPVFNLIFVGSFLRGKNVSKLIHAIDILNKDGIKFNLNLVGGGGAKTKEVMTLMNTRPYIKFHGKITDKNQLKQVYLSNHIFTMPSRHETFGLVYVEALSQGLPVLYTVNEGIDGFYSGIGESVNCDSVTEIAAGIKKIADNYETYNFDTGSILKNHDWLLISKNYINLYNTYSEK